MLSNLTSKKKISESYELCLSVLSKAKGLMFSRESRLCDNSLIFPFDDAQKWSLHMFFVFFPIDVVFLDGHRRVVDMKKNFKPFSFYSPRKDCLYVIEMKVGAIDKADISEGDVLNWS